MNAFIVYALKANLVMAVLLVGYIAALRGSAWLVGRRAWLIGTAVSAALLPLIRIPRPVAAPITFSLPAMDVASRAGDSAAIEAIRLIIPIYLCIALLLFTRLAVRALRAYREVKHGGDQALSFLNRVHVPDGAEPGARSAMLAHERAHVLLGHTYDILFLESLAALFWLNPLWRIALRELRLVHEHQADRRASEASADYPIILVAQAMGTHSRTLMNRFHSSNIKHRMLMLNRAIPGQRGRFLLALPLLALSFILTSADRAGVMPAAGEATVFTGTDKAAEFPGGLEALIHYLASNIKYPEAAQKEGIEGVVHVAFVVKSDGTIASAKIKRGVREDIDAESLRVVNTMPNWKPATVDGKAVESEMTLPISFRLSDK